MKSLSCVHLYVTPWIVAHQASLSMGFSRQEYWSGLPFPSQRIFPTEGWNPSLLHWRADSSLSEPPGRPQQSTEAIPPPPWRPDVRSRPWQAHALPTSSRRRPSRLTVALTYSQPPPSPATAAPGAVHISAWHGFVSGGAFLRLQRRCEKNLPWKADTLTVDAE